MRLLDRLLGRQEREQPSAATPSMVPPQRATVLVRDFLTISESEACIICEAVGTEAMSGDSRLTLTQRLIDAVDYEWRREEMLMDHWGTHEMIDVQPLQLKLAALNDRQTRSLIAAARRVWKAAERDDYEETAALRRHGLIT